MQPDRRGERAAHERAERNRSPDEEAHDGVHPALNPVRRDRLPQAHLRDVVDDRGEAAENHRGDQGREREACGRKRDEEPGQSEEGHHRERRLADAEHALKPRRGQCAQEPTN